MSKRILTVSLLLILLSSCTHWKLEYLERSVNTQTMDDVAKTLGPPDGVQMLSDSTTIWKYRYVETSKGNSSCVEYIAIFDKNKILREVRDQRC